MQLEKQQRVEWVDIAKGIGILLVVLGHCLPPYSLMNRIIFSFHMPLFFIISGFFFNKSNNFITILKKRIISLLVPYYFTCLMLLFLWFIFECPNPIIDTPIQSIKNILVNHIIGYLYGSGNVNICKSIRNIQPVGAAWFIPCLFVVNVLYFIFCNIKNVIRRLIYIILCASLGIVIGKYVYLPFSVDVAFIGVIFFIEGNIIFKYIHILYKKEIIVFVIVFFIISLFYIENISMNDRVYHYLIPQVIQATLGSLFCIYISIFINKNINFLQNILSFIGRNSIIILLYHIYIKDHIFEKSIILYNNYITFLYIIIVCYFISLVINNCICLKKIYRV